RGVIAGGGMWGEEMEGDGKAQNRHVTTEAGRRPATALSTIGASPARGAALAESTSRLQRPPHRGGRTTRTAPRRRRGRAPMARAPARSPRGPRDPAAARPEDRSTISGVAGEIR